MNFLNTHRNKRTIFILILIGVVIGFFYSSFLKTALHVSDDYELHAARIANYYLALKQGQLPPRWAPNLNGGFGYPVFNYIYPLPYLVATAFHIVGLSIQHSLNLSIFLALLGAGWGAFFLARKMIAHEGVQTLLALSYVLNPYTLLMVYWRGAFGELFFYAVLPYIFLTLLSIQRKEQSRFSLLRNTILLTAFLSVTIVSHLPSVIIIGLVAAVWVVLSRFTRPQLIRIFIACVAASCLTSFYTLPTLFERDLINVDTGEYLQLYKQHFLSVTTVFNVSRTITSSEYFLEVIQVGVSAALVLLAGTMAVFISGRKKLKHWQIVFWLGVTVFTVLLITSFSKPLWDSVSILQAQQFPWRLLWLINLAVFFIAAELFKILESSKQQVFLKRAAIGGFAFTIVWSAFAYAQPKGFFGRSDYEWYESVITGSSYDEQLPKTAQKSYTVPAVVFYTPLSAVQGELTQWQQLETAQGKYHTLNGTMLQYELELPSDSLIVHKRLYFPGWLAELDSSSVKFKTDSSVYPGLLQLEVPSGKHTIKVSFMGTTPIRLIGTILSTVVGIFYVVMIGVYFLLSFKTKRHGKA